MVFTLPDVEVGSILEYRVTMHRADGWFFLPTWEIQKQYFVHKAHYFFHPNGYQEWMYYQSHRLGRQSRSGQKEEHCPGHLGCPAATRRRLDAALEHPQVAA